MQHTLIWISLASLQPDDKKQECLKRSPSKRRAETFDLKIPVSRDVTLNRWGTTQKTGIFDYTHISLLFTHVFNSSSSICANYTITKPSHHETSAVRYGRPSEHEIQSAVGRDAVSVRKQSEHKTRSNCTYCSLVNSCQNSFLYTLNTNRCLQLLSVHCHHFRIYMKSAAQ
jgi:hypothetical protein